jgi:ring-1,2-phenylacetyl-CoA epoxidase subunit PaaE
MLQGLFRKKDKKSDSKNLDSGSYYDLSIKEIISETDDAISIVFENPEKKISYKSGQYLTLILQINGEEVRRSYSLSSSPETDEDLIVTVKKLEGGNVSNYINHELHPGDKIRVLKPMGNFTTEFDKDNSRTLLLFAGGSGITPLMSILKTLLIKEPKSRAILVYQNRNLQSIIFKKLIDELSVKYADSFKVFHILSKPEKTWQGNSGRITSDMIKKIIKETDPDLQNTEAFFCGPPGMMDTAERIMEDLGVDKSCFYKESFVVSPSKKEIKEEKKKEIEGNSRVVINLDGEDHEIMVKQNEFILETALDHDIDIPFSCQSGLCTTCRGKLISGKVSMEDPDGLTDDEIKEGYILTCVSHPASNEIKIEFD